MKKATRKKTAKKTDRKATKKKTQYTNLSTIKSSLRSAPVRLTDFSEAVMKIVKKIPRGKVATYSQVARLAGKPHAARGVGWILNSCAEKYKLPWQRVLNVRGKISFSSKTKEFHEQKLLLEKEGIRIDASGSLSLEKYQWKKDISERKTSPRTPRIFGS